MKTKPFNIDEAKAGAKLITRDGRPARIICYDAKGDCPVIALLTTGNVEYPIERTMEGTGLFSTFPNDDLFIVCESWRAKENEHYYTISEDMTISQSLELYDDYDNDMYAIGNYFRTREEAQSMAKKIKQLLATK